MELKFIKTADQQKAVGLTQILDFGIQGKCYLNVEKADYVLKLSDGKRVYIYGDVFYIREGQKARILGADPQNALKGLFSQKNLKDIVSVLEGQYIGFVVDPKKSIVQIFSDIFSREDSFYTQTDSLFCLSTNLDFIFTHTTPVYDQLMLAQLFSVYAWYTPKGTSIYKNVLELKVGEILSLSSKGLSSQTIEFKPAEIKEYDDGHLEIYYRTLRDSVEARSRNVKGKIWVCSSSGWDSSMILGLLVDMYGSKRVGMCTGSMLYSQRTGKINEFEINKVKKIGKFYGLKPLITDWNLKDKNAIPYWKSTAPKLKAKHMYSLTGFNFAKISDGIRRAAAGNQVVFNGETSDSFHNFGFSQFCTFFHTQKTFTEYADKMNCYLYGPSFYKKVVQGTHHKDKVYQIFLKMLDGVSFDQQWPGAQERLESYLLPIFYGSPRVPFAKTITNPLLEGDTDKKLARFPFRELWPQIARSFNEKTMYAWIIHLYHSMHSQGSTVNLIKHTMQFNDHRWRSPFHDQRLVDFLSQAPESWGRGLNFNHAKYPLKWVAQNKIKFPYELLQEGPHAYLYDIIEGFSIASEVTYRSAMTGYFKEVLSQRAYKNILAPSHFNFAYLDRLVNDYLNGKEAKGRDFTNLYSLVTLSSTGWY